MKQLEKNCFFFFFFIRDIGAMLITPSGVRNSVLVPLRCSSHRAVIKG